MLSEAQLQSRRSFMALLAGSPLLASSGALAQAPDAELIRSAADALNVFELEAVAKTNIPAAHWGYLSGGVLDDRTVAANEKAYLKWGLRARRMVDGSKVDLTTRVLGETLASPVILAPVSSQKAFHPDGELAVAKASGKRRTLQILSALTTVALEDVQAAHGAGVWQQVYPTNKPETGEQIIARANRAGAGAVVFTVDLAGGMRRETEALGARLDSRDCSVCHDRSAGYDFRRKAMFQGLSMQGVFSPVTGSLTWDYIDRLRGLIKGRFLIKGVMTPEDAELALARGVDGIIVSNHGGRAEESLIATLDVLPEIVTAVKGRAPVLIDGGVRRGTDVYKALALGAAGVCIGRPYVWGLGAFGEAGVTAAQALIDAELVSAMRQAGVTRIADIRRSTIAPAS